MRCKRDHFPGSPPALQRTRRTRTLDSSALLFAFTLVAGVGAKTACADELALLLNGKAYHMPHGQYSHLNENNWGAGLQYDFEQEGNWISFINVSGFKDSNANASYYFGGGLMRRFPISTEIAHLHVDVGLVAFLMHRKEFHNGNLFPGLLPALSLGTDRIALNITYVPKVEPKMVELLFFQLKIRLGKY